MTAEQQADSIYVQVARIEERVSSDRKNHAIQFKNLGNELNEIKSMLRIHVSDAETEKIQFAFVVKKIGELENIGNDLKNYHDTDLKDVKINIETLKKETWVLSWLYNHKKTTIFIMSAILFTFGDKLLVLYEQAKNKFF